MISTPFWIGTGFMKWVDITREEADRSVGSCTSSQRGCNEDDLAVQACGREADAG